MSRLFRLERNEKGQSIVEFALVLPVLLLILVGIIEFGWLFNGKITLTSAAREGARVAAIIKDEGVARDAIDETADLSGLTITNVKFDVLDGGLDNVDRVWVVVEGSMETLVGLFLPEFVDMDAEAYMRLE